MGWGIHLLQKCVNLFHKKGVKNPQKMDMAIAIKHTPVLEGKSSKRFNLLIASKKAPVSNATIRRILELTEKVLSTKKK